MPFFQRMKLNERSLSQFSISSAATDKEGYLNKKGELNRGYQRRWFVLKGNLLYYFERKSDKEAIGLVILENCHVELTESEEPYAFQISYGGAGARTYVLGAASSKEMESWMKAITNASYIYLKMTVEDLETRLQELTTTQDEMVNDSLSNMQDGDRFFGSTESANAEASVNKQSAAQTGESRFDFNNAIGSNDRLSDTYGRFEATVGTLIELDNSESEGDLFSPSKSPDELLPLNFNEFPHLEALHSREFDGHRGRIQTSQDDISLLNQRLVSGLGKAPRSKSERRKINYKPDLSEMGLYRPVRQSFSDDQYGLVEQGSVFKHLHDTYGASIWVKAKECSNKDLLF